LDRLFRTILSFNLYMEMPSELVKYFRDLLARRGTYFIGGHGFAVANPRSPNQKSASS
jgi:hypothetical protein